MISASLVVLVDFLENEKSLIADEMGVKMVETD